MLMGGHMKSHWLTLALCMGLMLAPETGQLRAQSGTTPPPGTLSRPSTGSFGGGSSLPPRIITGSQNTDVLRHRDLSGKPCLAIGGFARAHTSNPNLFDHVIQIKNSCAQSIKTEICYLRTQQCITLEVAGLATKEGILGTLPSMKDFQYEFRERF